MTKLKFKCELLSDVILNQKAATEGPNKTLDFIPGSNFLGIVAGQLYPKATVASDGRKEYDEENMRFARLMFHSDAVHFGDAHPAHGSNRTLCIPASLFFAKGEKEDERKHYVHHAITSEISNTINDQKIQLKQERGGFVDFIDVDKSHPAVRMGQHTNFAIKSAYDTDTRRSKDSQMYGYQSMEKGGIFYFSVDIDESLLEGKTNDIKNALIGIRHIGRSRSAQYGLVEISECNDYQEVQSGKMADSNMIVVYAESRLIFLDDNGQPTFQPTVKQLLGCDLSDVRIDWGKSQIRTFKYAPYNYVRRCFDTDRCGIEKGSVIVLKRTLNAPDIKLDLPQWVGSYQNEGFGKVIFNPPFLCADVEAKLTYQVRTDDMSEMVEKEVTDPQTPLTKYILVRKERDKLIGDIYTKVNEWVSSHGNAFHGNTYASQWGTIRSIAMKCDTNKVLSAALFGKGTGKDTGEGTGENTGKDTGYLVHGVAEEKWESHINDLSTFVNQNTPEHVVNLASMMQKKCSKKKNDGGQKDE